MVYKSSPIQGPVHVLQHAFPRKNFAEQLRGYSSVQSYWTKNFSSVHLPYSVYVLTPITVEWNVKLTIKKKQHIENTIYEM
jgi:hypothetical protein